MCQRCVLGSERVNGFIGIMCFSELRERNRHRGTLTHLPLMMPAVHAFSMDGQQVSAGVNVLKQRTEKYFLLTHS